MKRFLVLVLAILVVGCGSKTSEEGKQAASVSPQKTYIQEGINYLKEGNAVAAVKSFAKAIRENPRDVQGYLVLSDTYMHLKQYDRAIDTLLAASRVIPNDGQIYYRLAVNYGLSGDLNLAQSNAKKSVLLFEQTRDDKNLKKSVVLLQGLTKAQPDVASLPTTGQ